MKDLIGTRTEAKVHSTDPMVIYLEGSDWKGKCAKLLDALMCIRGAATVKDAKDRAAKAIKQFQESK